MTMKVIPTAIPDVLIIEPKVFGDDRGFFIESYNEREFNEKIGKPYKFVQDNHSKSKKGVLRGLHFQKKHPQGKLVKVVKGAVYDVAVDLRKGSTTFGKWAGVELTEDNKKMFYVPKGFAHGFQVLSEEAEIEYLVDNEYAPEYENGIIWNDENINIEWPIDNLIVSKKDERLIGMINLKNNTDY